MKRLGKQSGADPKVATTKPEQGNAEERRPDAAVDIPPARRPDHGFDSSLTSWFQRAAGKLFPQEHVG